MNRRVLLLVIASVIAAVGAGLVYVYVRGINSRALADQQPVTVLVAAKDVAQGTSVADASAAGDFVTRTVARASVAPGALSTVSGLGTQVLLAPLFSGQQLLPAEFGRAADVAQLPLQAGQVAVSVNLNDPQRVAGFLQPGSYVSILAAAQPGTGSDGPTPASKGFVDVLLTKVQVIAVGTTSTAATPATTAAADSSSGTARAGTNSETLPKALLTLAVTPDQAARVVYAEANGSGMYFAALAKDSPGVTLTAPVTSSNVFSLDKTLDGAAR